MISRGRKLAKNIIRDILHDTHCDRPSDVYSDDCEQGCGTDTDGIVAALVEARLVELHPETIGA